MSSPPSRGNNTASELAVVGPPTLGSVCGTCLQTVYFRPSIKRVYPWGLNEESHVQAKKKSNIDVWRHILGIPTNDHIQTMYAFIIVYNFDPLYDLVCLCYSFCLQKNGQHIKYRHNPYASSKQVLTSCFNAIFCLNSHHLTLVSMVEDEIYVIGNNRNLQEQLAFNNYPLLRTCFMFMKK